MKGYFKTNSNIFCSHFKFENNISDIYRFSSNISITQEVLGEKVEMTEEFKLKYLDKLWCLIKDYDDKLIKYVLDNHKDYEFIEVE